MKSGPALGDKEQGVASGQGAWMRRGSGWAGGDWGRASWFLINRKGLFLQDHLSAQLLGHNLSWGWIGGRGDDRQKGRWGAASVWTDSHWALQACLTPTHPPAPRVSTELAPAPLPQPFPPFLLLFLSSGTFNPSFDGQPRKDFFHILNLLAPANHLNLPPSWAPNRRLLKDTGSFFGSQRGAPGGSKSPPTGGPSSVKDGVQAREVGRQRQLCCLESSGFLRVVLSWGFPVGAEPLLGAHPQGAARNPSGQTPGEASRCVFLFRHSSSPLSSFLIFSIAPSFLLSSSSSPSSPSPHDTYHLLAAFVWQVPYILGARLQLS